MTRAPLTALVAGLVAVFAPAGAASAEVGAFPGAVKASVGPLIAGTGSYVHGTYAWTGYPYNDTTAYPSGVSGNSANLVQLQIGLTSTGDVRIHAILETLTDPTLPLLGVGFDTDSSTQTGAPTLPGWKANGPLGLDYLVTVSSQGTDLERWNGSGWLVVGHYPAQTDPLTNSMTAVVPRGALDPSGQSWRAVGALGLAGANSWLAGGGPIYNLAFVHEEPCIDRSLAQCNPPAVAAGTGWQDGESNLILNGQAPSAGAVATIDFAKLAAGTTELASAATPGFHTLLYYSHLNLGEGFRASTCIADLDPCSIYAGPYQPYVVEVPAAGATGQPVIFLLHGVSANQMWAGFPGNGSPPAVIVFPLGRGPYVGWGGGDATDGTPVQSGAYGEQDVLDVYGDVMRRLHPVADRVVMAGGSLGGLGAFHISEFHPDLFSSMFSEVGGDCCIASTNHAQPRRMENMINLPVRMVNGVLDPLANAADAATDLYPAFDSLHDIDYLSYELVRRSHDIGFTAPPAPDVLGGYLPLEQCLLTQLTGQRRVSDPARVVYVVDPNFEFTDPATGLDVVHTHAYWVSGLHPRGSDEARVDVTTLARAVHTVNWSSENAAGQNIASSGDLCGPNAAEQTSDAWTIHGVALSPGAPQPTSNGFTMTITQLATMTLDLRRMGISVDRPISADIAGDGPVAVALRGAWPNGEQIDVTRDGQPDGTVTAAHGEVILNRDFAWQQQNVPGVGTVDFSGLAPPAYAHTPAGDVSADQEPAGRVLGAHQYVLTPR